MSDCISRLKRMQGYDVVHPMGWDAFGLPAENAAIDKQVSPSSWTLSNISSMKSQLKQLDFNFDWDRELSTCDKDYYRWTQDIFLRLYENGLAYRKSATVNWDPIDLTVLANEQVDAQGRSWRSNAIVEKKQMNQWFFKITSMADRLHDDLDTLPGWPEEIKNMQKEWIGRSHGHVMEFTFDDLSILSTIKVFTTRAETLYGVTFVSVSPKHPVIDQIKEIISPEKRQELEEYLKKVESTLQSNDPELMTFNTGLLLVPPSNDRSNHIKLVISNLVHADYGTGAVMGVPAHNRADYQVAQKENLPIISVLEPSNTDHGECYDETTGIMINSKDFNKQTIKQVIEEMEKKKWAIKTTKFRIHDWLISRQRYWGAPIPIIHCDKCGEVPVPRDQLPVVLPTEIEFTGKGNILNQLQDWKNVKCPCCNGNAVRETDTMDTFVDSSWYFLRFLDNKNYKEAFSREKVNKYMPVDIYIGGIEHAILHLLYSRFFTKFLKDQNMIDHSEPFKVLLAQGLVKSPTYRDEITNKPIHPKDIDFTNPKVPISNLTRNKINITIEKMSKSKLNGIDPSEMIEKYGSDTLKLYVLFKAPPQNSLEWDTEGIEGCKRWIKRVEILVEQFISNNSAKDILWFDRADPKMKKEILSILYESHSTIDRVTESIDKYTFNTGISALMTLSNTLSKLSELSKSTLEYYHALRILILLLSPFAPNTSQKLWNDLVSVENIKNREFLESDNVQSSGNSKLNDLYQQSWPIASKRALTRESCTLVVQFEGKTKGVIDMPSNLTQQNDILEFVKQHEKFSKKFTPTTMIDKIFVATTKTGYSFNIIFVK
ncbi:hypothetical protein CYY_009563 [Polysphondylium violaceum]|uniref:leucine--tRNA ligase n=1 Tax=Polysphondylium violaceum TaxID=133409 RepID=A0A8J4UVW7_9MYCE|nr:hypothetical protein CYY_009563 [Polysphondylium violaceum]